MTSEDIYKKLAAKFSGLKIEFIPCAKLPVNGVEVGDSVVVIPATNLLEILKTLKTDETFSFDCLSDLTAIDRLKESRFEVVYHLFSYPKNRSLTVKVYLPRDDTAHVPTVEGLWPAANWFEREVFDLFGIKFDGHSDLRRIMMPEDWIGHPLRKDYKEQVDYHGIGTTRPKLIQ